jgi:outer membrane protein assembly factor BamB
VALDVGTGHVIWTRSVPPGFAEVLPRFSYDAPRDRLIVNWLGQTHEAMQASSGTSMWTFNMPTDIYAASIESPVVSANGLVVLSFFDPAWLVLVNVNGTLIDRTSLGLNDRLSPQIFNYCGQPLVIDQFVFCLEPLGSVICQQPRDAPSPGEKPLCFYENNE